MKSKSVLIVIPHLGIGGTEIQTLSLASALIASGYKVSIVCLFRCIPIMVEQFKKVHVNTILLSPEYDNYNVAVKYPKGLHLIRFLIKGLRKAIKISAPDVVHVQYVTPASTIIFLLKYWFRINRIIATAHTSGDIYSSLGIRIVRFLAKNSLNAFQCITLKAENSFFGSASLFGPDTAMRKHGNHFTIYNNLPSYIRIADSPRTGEPTVIGVVSRLERIKGMDLVIPAFAEVYAKHPHMKLLVVGDGSQRKLMERQVYDFGLPESAVEFAGRQGQDMLESFYDRIDILLMPSRSEGFGLTAIEGMARGCVPVVSNIGGLPEVVENSVSGLIHQTEFVNEMVAKIQAVISDTYLFAILSSGAHRRAYCFTKEYYNKQIADLYNRIK